MTPTLSLFLVLIAAKAAMLWGRPLPWSPAAAIAYIWQDVAVVLAFAALARMLRSAGRGFAPPGRRRHWPAWLLYFGLVGYAAINIPIARVLSTPLTWPMLRATRGTLADSILLYATAANLLLILGTIALAVALPRLPGPPPRRVLAPGLAAGLVIVALGPTATMRVDTAGLHRNPVVALATSAWPRSVAEARPLDGSLLSDSAEADDLPQRRGLAAGRNVVLVSLESTAAQYLRLYGGRDDLTPNLDRLAQHAIVFDAAYAVYPESIKGLFSILCSRFPALDTPPEIYAQVPCRSIAELLGEAGYRTGLFHSGRFGYLGMESIVNGRGFHTLEDAGHIGGRLESSFGVDEPSTVARILAWIDGVPSGQRFFVTYLPIAGHHPYETSEPGPFPGHDERGRYRNAIHDGDRALGALAEGLRARGLEQQTVWIVLGDHGEAFGQHGGNYGHTFFLYDENVRVPFLIAAPGAIDRTERSRAIVSLVDTAPTILDVLGLAPAPMHDGHSALGGVPRMAPFFTDYSLALVGLRDGRWKFVHDIGSKRSKLFDVAADPGETADLSTAHAARVASYERTLRGWSATQQHRVRCAAGVTACSD